MNAMSFWVSCRYLETNKYESIQGMQRNDGLHGLRETVQTLRNRDKSLVPGAATEDRFKSPALRFKSLWRLYL